VSTEEESVDKVPLSFEEDVKEVPAGKEPVPDCSSLDEDEENWSLDGNARELDVGGTLVADDVEAARGVPSLLVLSAFLEWSVMLKPQEIADGEAGLWIVRG